MHYVCGILSDCTAHLWSSRHNISRIFNLLTSKWSQKKCIMSTTWTTWFHKIWCGYVLALDLVPILFVPHPCLLGQDSMETFDVPFLPLKQDQSMLIYLLSWKQTGRMEEERSYSWGCRALGSNGDIHCFYSSDIRSMLKILGQEQADRFWHHATNRLF